jgi:hypothetical protein
MSELKLVDAVRRGIRPLIALYGLTNTGKTWGALTLARGMAGGGEIALADSENERASFYAGMFGGFKVVNIAAPFSPQRYIDVIEIIESSGVKVGILDGLSPEWNGVGGVLDMASESEIKSGKSGLHNWKKPKFEHAKLVDRLLRSSIPWIVCLRAKYLTKQGRDGGKTVIVKDDEPTAIQDDEFVFEATCVGLMLPNNRIQLKKWTHPDLKACFPTDGPLEANHGALIAQWCAAGAAPQPKSKSPTTAKALLWKHTESIHKGDPKALEKYLSESGYLSDNVSLLTLNEEQLRAIYTHLQAESK